MNVYKMVIENKDGSIEKVVEGHTSRKTALEAHPGCEILKFDDVTPKALELEAAWHDIKGALEVAGVSIEIRALIAGMMKQQAATRVQERKPRGKDLTVAPPTE